jgi:uncharacterized protein
MEEKIKRIKQKTLKYHINADGGHFFDHTERVYNMAVKIAESEKDVNIEVIKLAALLHDIARCKETKNEELCHAEEGVKMAKEILKDEGYDEKIISHVCECISTHRFSKRLEAKSKEGVILQDADRLDALGAITIARIFSKWAVHKRPLYDPNIPPAKEYPSKDGGKTSLNHFYEKILHIKPETFKTEFARQIAKSRYQYTKEYVDRFEKEWRGEL